jgi:3-hydroxyacyl-CoA dehydrogenase / enoyl-CoA hydratase / 3-hydroxybutyryl-CoA epimerase
MLFIYGMGLDAFVKRSAELAAKFDEGFVVTNEVVSTIRAFQPVY